jgi:hypothetical protein
LIRALLSFRIFVSMCLLRCVLFVTETSGKLGALKDFFCSVGSRSKMKGVIVYVSAYVNSRAFLCDTTLTDIVSRKRILRR